MCTIEHVLREKYCVGTGIRFLDLPTQVLKSDLIFLLYGITSHLQSVFPYMNGYCTFWNEIFLQKHPKIEKRKKLKPSLKIIRLVSYLISLSDIVKIPLKASSIKLVCKK